ncbi:MAG: hypothetical protein OXC02_00525 [Rhodobacteraceae bacterium]|nr:hypothetical protein [Paracoccaceae bacterium]
MFSKKDILRLGSFSYIARQPFKAELHADICLKPFKVSLFSL